MLDQIQVANHKRLGAMIHQCLFKTLQRNVWSSMAAAMAKVRTSTEEKVEQGF
jgi:hypothetical protein